MPLDTTGAHDAHMLRRVRRMLAAIALAAALVTPVVPGARVSPVRAATDFPPGYAGYHTYAEMVADINAVATAHPDIVQVFSIGKSYQGRDIWAAKVSDHVATDEAEPEVMFDGLHHSDEHMGLEMTLHILHWLADGYGTDTRITSIVNSREVWIVFAVNPDGAEYDISGGKLRLWRKNRQPNSGTTAIGTDLNRNYGYRWGAGGNTSTNPLAITYRGPSAFSAPETRAVRDFLASRVVGGRQQIRVAISFHEYGRLVMWPYGYTYLDVPADMTTDDHAALVAIGKHMAATNGYRPEQGSDLYLTSGTTRDYEYGTYRIFSYTFELSNMDYPKDTLIASETARNREAVLYLMERADCPLGVLGAAVRDARCGAFDDDMEVERGWTVNPDGTDTAAAAGRWARGNPAATTLGGVTLQPTTTSSGSGAMVTGLAAGSNADANDLDGRTTVRSTPISLSTEAGQQLSFRWYFAHGANATGDDCLEAIIEDRAGGQTVVWAQMGTPAIVGGSWTSALLPLDSWAGQTIRLRFRAVDAGGASTIEAGIDDVRVTRPTVAPRYAGPDRFATAAAVSANTFGTSVDVAYIANAYNFPDALAGAAAAGMPGANGPVLLVAPTGAVNASTAAELTRLKPQKIVVLGGTGVVSDAVLKTALAGYTGGNVVRYAGASRFATAADISAHTFGTGVDVAYIANAYNFPDALAGAAAAGTVAGPVLLVGPTGAINASTAAELTRLKPQKIVVLGGTGAVSDAVLNALKSYATGGNVVRYAGASRFATAADISAHTFGTGVDVAYVANAYNFPDALAGAAAAGTVAGPVLLVGPTGAINAATAAELTRLKPQKIVVLGGTGVVSEAVKTALASYAAGASN